MRTIDAEPRAWLLKLTEDTLSRGRIRHLFHAFRHDKHVHRVQAYTRGGVIHMVVEFAPGHDKPHSSQLHALDFIHDLEPGIFEPEIIVPGDGSRMAWLLDG